MGTDIIAIIKASAAMGAAEAIRRLNPSGDRISQRQAAKEFGLGFLRKNSGRLTVTSNGNRLEYSRAELEQVKASTSVAAMVARIEEHLIRQTS